MKSSADASGDSRPVRTSPCLVCGQAACKNPWLNGGEGGGCAIWQLASMLSELGACECVESASQVRGVSDSEAGRLAVAFSRRYVYSPELPRGAWDNCP
jgi:hypothetical protein